MAQLTPGDDPRVVPHLTVERLPAAIDFYCSVFGATERLRRDDLDGNVTYAELIIGDSVIMVTDEQPEFDHCAPPASGDRATRLRVYVEDVESVFERAVRAGARSARGVEAAFWGGRYVSLADPFGHYWRAVTLDEDLSEDEKHKRWLDPQQTGGQVKASAG